MDIETGEKSEPKAIFKDATGEVGAAILPAAFMGDDQGDELGDDNCT